MIQRCVVYSSKATSGAQRRKHVKNDSTQPVKVSGRVAMTAGGTVGPWIDRRSTAKARRVLVAQRNAWTDLSSHCGITFVADIAHTWPFHPGRPGRYPTLRWPQIGERHRAGVC